MNIPPDTKSSARGEGGIPSSTTRGPGSPGSALWRAIPVMLILPLLVAATAGCDPQPTLEYSLDTPPVVLTPANKAGITDGRGRFREIYCGIRDDHGDDFPENRECDDALHRLTGEPGPTGARVEMGPARGSVHVAVVPGIFGECVQKVVSPFSFALAHLESHGYMTSVISVSGRSSSAHNARQIRDQVLGPPPVEGEKLILVGYSKGTPDILEALVEYPELARRVTAVVAIAGVVSGSPLADGADKSLLELLKKIPSFSCPPGDSGGVNSLSRATRLAWLDSHQLPQSVRYFSVVAFAPRKGISKVLHSSYDQLEWIDPRNDSQVVFTDAVIPGSTLLGYANADHWAIALPIQRVKPKLAKALVTRNAYPREVLLEAVVRYVEEALGGQ